MGIYRDSLVVVTQVSPVFKGRASQVEYIGTPKKEKPDGVGELHAQTRGGCGMGLEVEIIQNGKSRSLEIHILSQSFLRTLICLGNLCHFLLCSHRSLARCLILAV